MNHPVQSAKQLFLLEEDITYLNCANMSPMLASVREAGLQALATRATPWKIASADWFTQGEMLRELAGAVFQTNPDNIALVPSVSYAMAVAAKNLPLQPGQEILVLEQQFPSNYYVWDELARRRQMSLIVVPRTAGKTVTQSIIESINTHTALVAIPNCHWIDGTWIDLEAVSRAVKAVGARLVLDLSQSLGVLPIDIGRIQPDFAVAVGYKWMLGPYGLGYMYVAPEWQQGGEPLEYSWLNRKGAEDFTALTNYTNEYRKGARKFDMGEFPQFNLVPMAIAALRQLLAWKIDTIQQEITLLTNKIIEYKKQKDTYTALVESVGHITSIPLRDTSVARLKDRLASNKVIVSFRGNSIRIAPHLYNNVADIDRLLECL